MYHEFASDPKVQSMNEAMQRRLVMVLCLRCQLADRDGGAARAPAGGDDRVTGLGLAEDEIAAALRISGAELARTRELFMRKGFIDDAWCVLAWDRRQFESDNSTARVRSYRDRKRHGGHAAAAAQQDGNGAATLHARYGSGGATPSDTETDTETERQNTPDVGSAVNEGSRVGAPAREGGGAGERPATGERHAAGERHAGGERHADGKGHGVETAGGASAGAGAGAVVGADGDARGGAGAEAVVGAEARLATGGPVPLADAEPGGLIDAGIEFVELREYYNAHGRGEAPGAGLVEYRQLRAAREWPGLLRIMQGIDAHAESGKWRRGFAPGLARFLRERGWLAEPVEDGARLGQGAGQGGEAGTGYRGPVLPPAPEIDDMLARVRAGQE